MTIVATHIIDFTSSSEYTNNGSNQNASYEDFGDFLYDLMRGEIELPFEPGVTFEGYDTLFYTDDMSIPTIGVGFALLSEEDIRND